MTKTKRINDALRQISSGNSVRDDSHKSLMCHPLSAVIDYGGMGLQKLFELHECVICAEPAAEFED
jgi:hypothetical protein